MHLYDSRPPFVFFFNPTLQLQQINCGAMHYVGYRIERDDGEWVSIDYKTFKVQYLMLCIMHNSR